MNDGARPPVQPVLFVRVQEYVVEIERGRIKPGRRLKPTESIMLFCQLFFAQFFRNVLDNPLQAIDETARTEAVALRLELTGQENAARRRLIALFETLCTLWEDVQGLDYGMSRTTYDDFHKRYLPDLLAAIEQWAATTNDPELQARATEAQRAYARARRNLTR